MIIFEFLGWVLYGLLWLFLGCLGMFVIIIGAGVALWAVLNLIIAALRCYRHCQLARSLLRYHGWTSGYSKENLQIYESVMVQLGAAYVLPDWRTLRRALALSRFANSVDIQQALGRKVAGFLGLGDPFYPTNRDGWDRIAKALKIRHLEWLHREPKVRGEFFIHREPLPVLFILYAFSQINPVRPVAFYQPKTKKHPL